MGLEASLRQVLPCESRTHVALAVALRHLSLVQQPGVMLTARVPGKKTGILQRKFSTLTEVGAE